jgi:hypothetical protein
MDWIWGAANSVGVLGALVVSIIALLRGSTKPAWKIKWREQNGRHYVSIRNVGEAAARATSVVLRNPSGELVVVLDSEEVFPGDKHEFECRADTDGGLRVGMRWHQMPRSAKARTKIYRMQATAALEEDMTSTSPPVVEIAKWLVRTMPGLMP